MARVLPRKTEFTEICRMMGVGVTKSSTVVFLAWKQTSALEDKKACSEETTVEIV